MLAPMMRYLLSKLISVYFPNLLLLSFLVVLALPIAWHKETHKACGPRCNSPQMRNELVWIKRVQNDLSLVEMCFLIWNKYKNTRTLKQPSVLVNDHLRDCACKEDLWSFLSSIAPGGPLNSYLSDGIGGQDLVFYSGFTAGFADYSEVPHSVAGGHSLPCTRLPADDDGLVLVVSINGMSTYVFRVLAAHRPNKTPNNPTANRQQQPPQRLWHTGLMLVFVAVCWDSEQALLRYMT